MGCLRMPIAGRFSACRLTSASRSLLDNITLSATAENLDSPGTPVPAASYSVQNTMNTVGYCQFSFTPSVANITSGRIQFTITATGNGGPTSKSFVCTVTEGAVATPPRLPTQAAFQFLQRKE